MVKLEDLDPTLMMHPALNMIIQLSNLHIEGVNGRLRRSRARLSATCLYHMALDEIFKRTRTLTIIRGKPAYPIVKYLGNVEISWLPDWGAWKVMITNGGLKRKNAQLKWVEKEVLYVRRLSGVYVIDSEMREKKQE